MTHLSDFFVCLSFASEFVSSAVLQCSTAKMFFYDRGVIQTLTGQKLGLKTNWQHCFSSFGGVFRSRRLRGAEIKPVDRRSHVHEVGIL